LKIFLISHNLAINNQAMHPKANGLIPNIAFKTRIIYALQTINEKNKAFIFTPGLFKNWMIVSNYKVKNH